MGFRHFSALIAVVLSSAAPAFAQAGACPPTGHDRAALVAWKTSEFPIDDTREAQRRARALTACLADPDPVLRDEVAYEGLARMLSRRDTTEATENALAEDLLARLRSSDPNGFEAPFAALVLAQIVRADRMRPHFNDARYDAIRDGAITYFEGVRDYRGFDEREGWRHGVAHGADLLMQVAFHDHYGRAEHLRIRAAIAAQLTPPGHFYIYGESERLAVPILVIARRGTLEQREWDEGCAALAAPAPLARWTEAFASHTGLARLHNLKAFLQVIYLNASLSDDPNLRALLPGAETALRTLP